jgi:hypothetical protein
MKCNKDFFVFKEGDPVEGAYIIRQGEFVVSRKLILPKKSAEKQGALIHKDPQRALVLQNKYFSKNAMKQVN